MPRFALRHDATVRLDLICVFLDTRSFACAHDSKPTESHQI